MSLNVNCIQHWSAKTKEEIGVKQKLFVIQRTIQNYARPPWSKTTKDNRKRIILIALGFHVETSLFLHRQMIWMTLHQYHYSDRKWNYGKKK